MSFSNPPRYSAETAAAYVASLLELLGSQDPIDIMDRTADELQAAVSGRSDDALETPEADGKWSIVEVIQHLADSEIVYGYRMRLIVAEDEPSIPGYDQNAWASNLRYANVPVSTALSDFRALRAINLRWLQGLSDKQLDRWGMHNERGQESVQHIVKLLAAHDLVHLNQIKRILTSN